MLFCCFYIRKIEIRTKGDSNKNYSSFNIFLKKLNYIKRV